MSDQSDTPIQDRIAAQMKADRENKLSHYARVFDETSTYWLPNKELNLMFLNMQQHYFNQRLQAIGYVFLNEVYEVLGLQKSTEGQMIGWLRFGSGDGYIDFKLHVVDFPDSQPIHIDFNVDGSILYTIKEW